VLRGTLSPLAVLTDQEVTERGRALGRPRLAAGALIEFALRLILPRRRLGDRLDTAAFLIIASKPSAGLRSPIDASCLVDFSRIHRSNPANRRQRATLRLLPRLRDFPLQAPPRQRAQFESVFELANLPQRRRRRLPPALVDQSRQTDQWKAVSGQVGSCHR
jgi:hypothetical protein